MKACQQFEEHVELFSLLLLFSERKKEKRSLN